MRQFLILQKMSYKTNFVFKALLIISWILFIGLSIEAGGLLVNFFCSIFWPDFVGNLYQKLDLSGWLKINPYEFYKVYTFILAIAILKACLFYRVVLLMHRIDLQKPFAAHVGKEIAQLSYYTLVIGFISVLASESTKVLPLSSETVHLQEFWGDGQAFILMGAVLYMIATIFKKGVELQTENDLTV